VSSALRVAAGVVAFGLALYVAMWLGAYDAAYFGGSP
jgi:Flp pilus assembly protein protease CpaA